jgi:hypothetical protein
MESRDRKRSWTNAAAARKIGVVSTGRPQMRVLRCQGDERGSLTDAGRNYQDGWAFEFSGRTITGRSSSRDPQVTTKGNRHVPPL